VTDCLTIWTIYHHPSDYPDSWVLRGHDIFQGGLQAHEVCFVAPTLNEIRAKVPPGTWCIGREPEDHPAIYESWIASADFDEVAGLISAAKMGISRALAPADPARRRDRSPEINRRIPLSSKLADRGPDIDVGPDGKKKSTAGATLGLEAKLAILNRQVIQGEARIREMGAAIERRRQSGLNTEIAEHLLNTMLETLSLLTNRKAGIEAELRRWNTA
jgi:hypothetical protein